MIIRDPEDEYLIHAVVPLSGVLDPGGFDIHAAVLTETVNTMNELLWMRESVKYQQCTCDTSDFMIDQGRANFIHLIFSTTWCSRYGR